MKIIRAIIHSAESTRESEEERKRGEKKEKMRERERKRGKYNQIETRMNIKTLEERQRFEERHGGVEKEE